MVNFLKLKIRALLTSFVAICTVYIFLVRKVTRKAEFNLIIPDARAEEVWSVMADFRWGCFELYVQLIEYRWLMSVISGA